ncbi:hypothetical protein I4U23_005973 [Adineta vaga]|nr:hypothetical protein I4U23_005973 [Adineta vaga]
MDTNATIPCNGKLKPNSNYSIIISACNMAGCRPVLSKIFRTKSEIPIKKSYIWIYASVAGGLVLIIIVFIAIWQRKRICGKRSKPTSDESAMIGLKTVRTPKRPKLLRQFINLTQQDKQEIYDEYNELNHHHSHSSYERSFEDQKYKEYDRYRDIFARGEWKKTALYLRGEHRLHDYINANQITSYDNKKQYIACQGPMRNTCEDFWDMIYQYRVSKIVMLTHYDQPNKTECKPKCFPYFPIRKNARLSFDHWTVTTQNVQYCPELDLRIRFILLRGKNRNCCEHRVIHYCFTSWKDFRPLEPNVLLQLIELVNQHGNEENRTESSTAPEVIHCSAGIGRTGTYIAVDTIVRLLNDHSYDLTTMKLDIMSIVYHLREDRMRMVQTDEQYMLVNLCVEEYLKRTNQLSLITQPYVNMTHLSSNSNDQYMNISQPKDEIVQHSKFDRSSSSSSPQYQNLIKNKYSTQRSISMAPTDRSHHSRRKSTISSIDHHNTRTNRANIHEIPPPIPHRRPTIRQDSLQF